MNPNPVLMVLKIAAFAIMAFLLGLVFWQGNRREEANVRLQSEVAQLRLEGSQQAARLRESQQALQEHRAAVDRLSGSVEALTGLLGSGAVRMGGGEGGVRPVEPSATAPRTHVTGPDAPPGWVKGRARELWGRYPNYLKPDPDPVKIPPLTTEGIDVNGRATSWMGPALSGLNPLTKSDGGLTRYIKTRSLGYLAEYHDKNPDLFKPSVALRAEVNPEHTEYVVWLRPGVRWHPPQVDLSRYPHLKGEHFVTSRDVKFTMDLILDSVVEAAHIRSYYSECSGVEIVDDSCFIVRWKKKQWNSRAWTLPEFHPLPEFVFAFDEKGERYTPERLGPAFNDHWFYRDNHFIGCGRYVVAEYDPSSHCLLRRFDDYFDAKELPPIREHQMEMFPNRDLQVQRLLSGEHDYGNLLPQQWERYRKDPGTPLFKGEMEETWAWSTQFGWIGWKMTHPIFKDLRVRRAMTMACDRQRILDSLHLGKGKTVTGPHYVNSPFSPPDLKPLPFDLEASKALLAEAGWKDADGNGVLDNTIDGQPREFRFKAMIPQNEEWKGVFEIFKEDLAKIGVQMELEQLHWGQFAERLDDRKFECTALYWDTSGWESDLFQLWHSSQVDEAKSSNHIEFRDAEVDRRIEELRDTFDLDRRRQLQREAHARIAELQPYTFINTIQLPMLTYKKRLGNVKPTVEYALRPFFRPYAMYVRSPQPR